MLASYTWLKELSSVDASAEKYAEKLTSLGLEVETSKEVGTGFEKIVVAEVKSKEPHPKKDNWTLVDVFDGEQTHQVVCGANNVPEPGRKVIFAQPGATLPNGIEISERKMAGIISTGMLCAESELEIGNESDGIFVFEESETCDVGTSIAEALNLRDTIFEIGLTPNRPDCLGHIGLAREICLGFGKTFSYPSATFARHEQISTKLTQQNDGQQSYNLEDFSELGEGFQSDFAVEDQITIRIEDALKCPLYGAAMVRGIKVTASPFAIRYRLFNLGIRSLSNVVDVTNLVMLEWGHPIHAFDVQKIQGRSIVVRNAKLGEEIKTLDGENRACHEEDLLICDEAKPIALAGVMGGANSEIDEGSCDALIECAYFDPRSVRKTSKKLSMHTEASHRFERGVDPNAVPFVLARAVALVRDLCGGQASKNTLVVYPKEMKPMELTMGFQEVRKVLGMESIAEKDMVCIWESIGCQVSKSSNDCNVRVPTWRPDILRNIDLVEEIARAVGFDQLPTKMPQIRLNQKQTDPQYRLVQKIKEVFVHLGFNEAICYSFVSPSDLEQAKVSTNTVAVANPLSEEKSVLRTSLLPGLLQAARQAFRHQTRTIQIFEVGTVFAPTEPGQLADERQVLSFVIGGPLQQWIGEGASADFYDGKGFIQSFLTMLTSTNPQFSKVTSLDKVSDKVDFFHPQKRACVTMANHNIGYLGEIHPEVTDAFELEDRLVYGEIEINTLITSMAEIPELKAKELPKFPSVNRDIATLVDKKFLSKEIEEKIFDLGAGLVENVELFDLFEGAQIPEGMRSLAFHVNYRDHKQTLTDKRVDSVHQKVTQGLIKHFNLSLR